MDEVLIAKLMKCTAKHCDPIAKDKRALRQHAIRMWIFRKHHERIMRRFTGQNVLIDLDRHLRLAEAQIKKLQAEHAEVLQSLVYAMSAASIEDKEVDPNNVQPVEKTGKVRVKIERTDKEGNVEVETKEELFEVAVAPHNPDKLSNRLEAISSIRSGVKKFNRSYVGKAPPLTTSEKTEPAAVASACRQTWRDVYGGEKVPKNPQANPLGPMARFIDDIFFVFELGGTKDTKDVKQPNPVSALKFVDRLGGDEALEISLTWE